MINNSIPVKDKRIPTYWWSSVPSIIPVTDVTYGQYSLSLLYSMWVVMLTVSTRQTGSCVHLRDKHVHCNWSPNNGLIYRAVRGNAILSTSVFFTLHCVTCDKYKPYWGRIFRQPNKTLGLKKLRTQNSVIS